MQNEQVGSVPECLRFAERHRLQRISSSVSLINTSSEKSNGGEKRNCCFIEEVFFQGSIKRIFLKSGEGRDTTRNYGAETGNRYRRDLSP